MSEKKTPATRRVAAKSKGATKKATGRTGRALAATALPPLPEDMMNDALRAIRDQAEITDRAREVTDANIALTDSLIKEAVDQGERYRDIAAAAGRTVPWVQMSLRRVAGVPTHPAAPIPDGRIRKPHPRAKGARKAVAKTA